MQHRGSDPAHPGWTRTYAYNEASQLEPGKQSNRLTSTTHRRDDRDLQHRRRRLRRPRQHAAHAAPAGHAVGLQGPAADDPAPSGQCCGCGRRAAPGRAHLVRLRLRRPARAKGDRACRRRAVKDERIYLGGFEIYRRNGANPARARDAAHHGRQAAHRAWWRRARQGNDRACRRNSIRYQFGNHLGSASLELDDAGADHFL